MRGRSSLRVVLTNQVHSDTPKSLICMARSPPSRNKMASLVRTTVSVPKHHHNSTASGACVCLLIHTVFLCIPSIWPVTSWRPLNSLAQARPLVRPRRVRCHLDTVKSENKWPGPAMGVEFLESNAMTTLRVLTAKTRVDTAAIIVRLERPLCLRPIMRWRA